MARRWLSACTPVVLLAFTRINGARNPFAAWHTVVALDEAGRPVELVAVLAREG
jgi:hypothetical protein